MKPSITVAGLGPGDPGLLTLAAADALRNARRLILRTGRHGAARWLEEQGIPFESFDGDYDRFEDFDSLHEAMARRLWTWAAETPLVFGVMDPATDGAVAALKAQRPEGAVLRVLPGIGAADVCAPAAPGSPESLTVLPADRCGTGLPDPRQTLLITEIDSRVLAGGVKLWLGQLLRDEHTVYFFPPSEKADRKPAALPLAELDRQKRYDHTCCVLVPPAALADRERYDFRDLVAIMARLRSPGGCPWDGEQTHESLRKYLLEEAWEAAGAIDEGDMDHLADELGDVLLQIVFHADIGRACGEFDITDVTTAVCRKMIYRHGHIFGTDRCETAEDVSRNWERLKRAERGQRTQGEVLASVSRSLPGLMRADKVQKKAADVGFDWSSAEEALPKIHEEADEVLAELKAGRDPEEELGDLLFAAVNVARLAGRDSEHALALATEKFTRRFTAMERLILAEGRALEGMSLAEMDAYWNRVKREETEHAT